MTEPQQSERVPAFELDVWWGLIAGPLAWGLNEGASYAITQHACSTGHFYLLRIIGAISVIMAMSGFLLAFAIHRRLPHNPETEEQLPRDRAYFMAFVGMAMSLAFALIVIAQALPQVVLSPCS